ncbi:NADP-dependent oxidoreductase [Chondromyces crocatus]|uniref:Alcohol dehydrogenase n=1 Tax=Chondromyces crocatus TaxID=52 RepID=A0A0K1ECN6_CHOCO|nr:NADP-dependent oxidoreductase [Chondromyces crocatus]AKT38462.1 alcohol dehydrogenase [Chondromyces crocatus]
MSTRAARVHSYDVLQRVRVEDAPDPVAGAGEVLLDVAAAGVNPIDWKIVEGYLKDLLGDRFPLTPGVEVCGTVAALGEGVEDLALGDTVFGLIGLTGGYATRIAVPARFLAPKPRSLSHLEAGASAAAALTAFQAVHELGKLTPGQRVLVHAAAGGVGSFAVQMARIAGAEVIGVTSAGNEAYVLGLGASRVIDYRTERFENLVAEVDLVLDLVGGDTLERSWDVLKPGGLLVSAISPPDPARAAAVGARGIHLVSRSDSAQLREIGGLFDSGKLRLTLAGVFPLDEVVQALEISKAGRVRGKLVLDTRS